MVLKLKYLLKSSNLIVDSQKILCSLQAFTFATSRKFRKSSQKHFLPFILVQYITILSNKSTPPCVDYILAGIETYNFFHSVHENRFTFTGGFSTSQFVIKVMTEL